MTRENDDGLACVKLLQEVGSVPLSKLLSKFSVFNCNIAILSHSLGHSTELESQQWAGTL